jgi:hypothetical protein
MIMDDKNTSSKVNVLFSTSKLLVTFLEDPYFEGRKLVIKGEALCCGFDAYPSTMQWAKPFENEEIDEQQKKHIRNVICEWERNCKTGFQIIWEE